MSVALAPIAFDLTSQFVNKRDSPSQVKVRLEQWSPRRPHSIDDVENRIHIANERREEFLFCKQAAVKSAEVKRQMVKAKLATKFEEEQEALEKRIEAMETRASKNRKEYMDNTLWDLRQKNSKKNKRELTKLQDEKQRLETHRVILEKQAQAQARAQEAIQKVQGKAARMANQPHEKLAALRLAEETSVSLTKELNQQRHAEAEARKVAALQETIAKGVRLGSPVKRRAELAQREQNQREERRRSLEKRLTDAQARVEAIRQDIARKAANMASPRVKLSSASQADATPVATADKVIELTSSDGTQIFLEAAQSTGTKTTKCGSILSPGVYLGSQDKKIEDEAGSMAADSGCPAAGETSNAALLPSDPITGPEGQAILIPPPVPDMCDWEAQVLNIPHSALEDGQQNKATGGVCSPQ